MDASSIMEIVFGLVGGLAIFLYGMNLMSDGLQKAAGQKMKDILAMFTQNRVLGVLSGAICTAVLQSSSATTVMAIGFVSARLMTTRQAIAVIFGANIGTTMTAQLMAFKISDYILPIIFIGFIMWFVFKDERMKSIGQSILAFGLLFLGIETMGDVMKPLASSAVFLAMIEQVKDIPALGVLVGTLMTLVVQSSSATIAVLQNFASQAGPDGVSSVLGLEGAIPILLGDNIGTTITALLACIGQSRAAKRVAVAHCTFNISGALIFIWLVPFLAAFVQYITPGAELDVIARQIANAHTTFNITMTLLWLPFLGVMVKIVNFVVPQSEVERNSGKLVSLDNRIVNQPAFAIKMLRDETSKYAVAVQATFVKMAQYLATKDKKLAVEIDDDTKIVQQAREELNDFTIDLLAAGSLTEEQVGDVSELAITSEAIGHINERCGEIVEVYSTKTQGKKSFPEKVSIDLSESMEVLGDMYDTSLNYLMSDGEETAEGVAKGRKKVIKRQRKDRKTYLQNVSDKNVPVGNKQAYDHILIALERISNECFTLIEHTTDLPVLTNPETIEPIDVDKLESGKKEDKKEQEKELIEA